MKKYLKKSLSIFLAFLMVFTSFVFAPEMFMKSKAAFSAGTYYIKFYADVNGGGDGQYFKWNMKGKPTNGTGTEGAIGSQVDKVLKNDNTQYVIFETTSSSFPTKITGDYYNKVVWPGTRSMDATIHLLVGPDAEHAEEVSISASCTSSGGSGSASASGNSISFDCRYKYVYYTITVNESPSPEIKWVETAQAVNVPASTTNNSYTSSNAIASVLDQYGVVWGATQPQFVVANDEEGTSSNVTGVTANLNSDNKAAITVENGARAYCEGEASNVAYVRARVAKTTGSNPDYVYAEEKLTLTVNNYKVDVNYKLNTGTYFGTEDDQQTEAQAKESVYWGAGVENFPTSAYKLGYRFKGMYTASSNGTQVTNTAENPLKINPSGEATTSVNYYAQWNAIDNKVAYYNSDGQLINQYTGKYDTAIRNAGAPGTPTYPGKTQLQSGNFEFKEWVIWDWPGHPKKAGVALSNTDMFNLDDGDDELDTETIKVIATYTLNGEVKTYTAAFKQADGSRDAKSQTSAYWSPVTPPDLTTNPNLAQGYTGSKVLAKNGFDLTNYDYTFEGWTLTVPANGKWLEVEAGEAEFTSADTYRLKANVTFYPCYSKATKRCEITKKYYVFNDANNLVVNNNGQGEKIKDEYTELGKTYDLGIPERFSFNKDGYTYTFIGWKVVDGNNTTITQGTGTPDIPYANGKAEITVSGDKIYFAIYEKTEIKYNAYYYNGSELVASYEDLSRYSSGTNLVTYNTATQFDGATPERARVGQTGYTFVGWVEDQTKTTNPAPADLVTTYTFGEQSKNFYAAYATFDYYTVTFKNDGGDVLQTSKDYVANNTIAYTATAPDAEDENVDVKMFIPVVKNKASGAQFQYTFMGWQSNNDAENTLTFEDEVLGTVNYAVASGSNITVMGNRVYTAVFKKEIREYTIYLYGVGSNPNVTINDDEYECYTYTDEDTNVTTNYFVKDKKIYTSQNDEYVLYAGELKVADLTPIKPPAKKEITLKYGDNILNAVKALYTYDGNGTADRNVTKIDDHNIEILPYGETEKVNLPYETKQYSYSFNGWSPSINPNATVIGDASYVATYRTDNVLYNVHWFTPTACDSTAPYAGTTFDENVTYYRYRRAIAVPAKTPTVDAPTAISNYSWTFLGWYECDANQVIKKDADDNEIKYVKGTLADPDTNGGSRDYYYVAKFGFVPNNYTVRVYDADGTELLGTYKGAYNSPVYITNFEKKPDATYHYELEGFEDKAGVMPIYPADNDTDATEYTVSGNVDLKVKYRADEHGWTLADFAKVDHTTPATYAANGIDTITCICGYKKTEVVPKLVDENGPVGKVAIKSYNWDKEGGPTEAYIRNDTLVAIMAVDQGRNDIEDNPTYNEGEGIKSIVYTWSNGATGGTVEYAQYTKTSANVDIQVPAGDDFTEGMTLKVIITDWTNRTYTITTGELYIDTVKPVIEAEATCKGFSFGIKEDHLDSVTLAYEGEEIDLSGYELALDSESEYAAAYSLPGEDEVLENGEYVVTVTDKAGNTATMTFNITNSHDWNNGKITQALTCTDKEIKTFTCTVCGATKTEEKEATGHKWNATYEGEGDEAVFVEYNYTVDVAATCLAAGSKSIHCSVCGVKMEDSDAEIPALGHDYKYDEKAATCASAGYKITTCRRCDLYEYEGYEQLEHVVKLDAEGADANGWIVGKVAKCNAKGNKYQVCALCGEKINKEDIPMIAHNFEDKTPEGNYCVASIVEGVTPDTYHLYKCKDCGYSYEVNTVALDHDYATVNTPANCTHDELNVYTCTICGYHYEDTERLTALGHEWATDYTVDVAATCLTAGSKSIHCTREDCTEKKDVTVIPALGHDYNDEITTPATAHTAGVMTHTCKRASCTEETEGHSYTEAIAPTGHVYNDGVVTTPATCTSEGVMTYTCSDCDATVEGHTYTAVIPKKAHEAGTEKVSEEAATCIAYAKTVYKCKNCEDGTVTVYGEELAGHKKGDLVKVVTVATCTTAGKSIYNCEVCGQTMSETIPATGDHDYVETIEVPATCLTDGSKKLTCKVCGDEKFEDIEAPGSHDWNTEYTVDTEPTCTTTGSKSIHCSRCNTVQEGSNAVINQLGHNMLTDEAVAPTCSKTGLTAGKHCSRCDKKEAQEEVAKLPHTQGDLLMVNKVPTCVAKGESVYRCSVCEESYKAETPIDPNAHNWGAWGEWTETAAATCTVEGSEKRTRSCKNTGCTAEDDVETRTIAALGHDMILDASKDPNPVVTTENGVTTTVTYYICNREGCDVTEEKTETTTVYTVTVKDTADNVYATVTIPEGEKLTVDKIGTLPTKATTAEQDGAYVIKWMVDGSEVTLPLEITDNITLTYDFTFVANKYTVTFYNYGGKIISSKEYVKGAAVDVPEDQYVSGYEFYGWTDGTANYAANAIPTVTANVEYSPWVVSSASIKTYYVTFKNDTGTKTLYTAVVKCDPDQTSKTFNLPADLADPTKDHNTSYHYEFKGWVDASTNTAVTFPITVSSNITLKAKFENKEHQYGAGSVTQNASCTKPEITKYICTVCGNEKTVYTKEATGHDYREIGREVDGNITRITYRCNVCGYEYTRTVTTGTQQDVIVVKVTDGSAPISGAKVTVYIGSGNIVSATTDGDGCAYFSKDVLSDGSYQTKVTKDNYDSASGTMVVKNGTASLKLTIKKQVCHSVCHASGFFGTIRRAINGFLRFFNKSYTCCSCGECGRVY